MYLPGNMLVWGMCITVALALVKLGSISGPNQAILCLFFGISIVGRRVMGYGAFDVSWRETLPRGDIGKGSRAPCI